MLWNELTYELYCELEDAYLYDEENDTNTLDKLIEFYNIDRDSIPTYAFDFDT